MRNEEKVKEQSGASKLFTPDGKPLRVLSTSLGVALLANVVMATGVSASNTNAATVNEPKLVSWSTDEVKAYFDKQVDWSLPIENANELQDEEGGSTSDESGQTTVVRSGFGMSDLLLYSLLLNRGSSYSSSGYYSNRPAYNTRTNTSYKPQTYTSDKFQNKQVAGTSVRPKTSTSTGTVTRRTTSATKGSIGGNSGSKSSSGKTSSGSFFGG